MITPDFETTQPYASADLPASLRPTEPDLDPADLRVNLRGLGARPSPDVGGDGQPVWWCRACLRRVSNRRQALCSREHRAARKRATDAANRTPSASGNGHPVGDRPAVAAARHALQDRRTELDIAVMRLQQAMQPFMRGRADPAARTAATAVSELTTANEQFFTAWRRWQNAHDLLVVAVSSSDA